MRTAGFRWLGLMLAVIIGGVAGWVLFPLFTAFGVGLGGLIFHPAGVERIDCVAVAIGYYRVHSHTHAIFGAILGGLTALPSAWRKMF